MSRGVTCVTGREGPGVTRKRVVEALWDGVEALEELEPPGFASQHCCFLAVCGPGLTLLSLSLHICKWRITGPAFQDGCQQSWCSRPRVLPDGWCPCCLSHERCLMSPLSVKLSMSVCL